MVHGIRKFKPGVARKVHIISAASLWTVIGGLLLYRGIGYLLSAREAWLILPGILFGTLKSSFILDRSALRGLERIRNFSDKLHFVLH